VTPSRSAFSYSVLRIVPDIEREEFLNAGLILFCRERRYLAARAVLDDQALRSLHTGFDATAIRDQLRFVEAVAAGELTDGPLAPMSQSERFHWLTTPRSTLVQPGPLRAGTTEDPAETFEHLYEVMVSRAGAR
jgi:Protein of unknown function (DUF3037)